MADKEGGAATLPAALGERERSIILADGSGSIVVPKWSWGKALKVFRILSDMLDDIGEERASKLKGKKTLEVVGVAIDLLGEKLMPLMQASVRTEDASKVTDDLAPEDVISILEAVIDLNMTEGLTKKAQGLWRRFARIKTENAEKSASKNDGRGAL
jgi:hypothetical protein